MSWRKPILAGNWKMFKPVSEAVEFALALRKRVDEVGDVDIVVAPTFPALYPVAQALMGSRIKVAAQDVYWEKEGAFTGEVSPAMLRHAGCTYGIVGHSERRQYFQETDQSVNQKVRALLAEGLRPIVCLGESLEEREGGKTFERAEAQLTGALQEVTAVQAASLVVAYEPIWAIGTGKTATTEQAQEVQAFLRQKLTERYDEATAAHIRIQYGGSVKPANIAELMAQEDIDGALVGGASLKLDSFEQIVKYKR
jgi:triosephosphate isomerase (TIM)